MLLLLYWKLPGVCWVQPREKRPLHGKCIERWWAIVGKQLRIISFSGLFFLVQQSVREQSSSECTSSNKYFTGPTTSPQRHYFVYLLPIKLYSLSFLFVNSTTWICWQAASLKTLCRLSLMCWMFGEWGGGGVCGGLLLHCKEYNPLNYSKLLAATIASKITLFDSLPTES